MMNLFFLKFMQFVRYESMETLTWLSEISESLYLYRNLHCDFMFPYYLFYDPTTIFLVFFLFESGVYYNTQWHISDDFSRAVRHFRNRTNPFLELLTNKSMTLKIFFFFKLLCQHWTSNFTLEILV